MLPSGDQIDSSKQEFMAMFSEDAFKQTKLTVTSTTEYDGETTTYKQIVQADLANGLLAEDSGSLKGGNADSDDNMYDMYYQQAGDKYFTYVQKGATFADFLILWNFGFI